MPYRTRPGQNSMAEHTPILPAHRQRILDASRRHPALQGGPAASQHGSMAGTAAEQVFRSVMEEGSKGATPGAAATAAAAEQASSARSDGSTSVPETAGHAAPAGQELTTGQGGAGSGTDEQQAPGQEPQQASLTEHGAAGGATSCPAALDASQQCIQADDAAEQEQEAADSCRAGAAGVDAADRTAAAPTDTPTAEAHATLAHMMQKLHLVCVPWKASQPAAVDELAATAAGRSGAACTQLTADIAQQQQHQSAAAAQAVPTVEAPAAADNGSKQQPDTEVNVAADAAAATAAPAAAAAAPPVEAGPLMANKTALPHSMLLSASVQRRPAPTAWAQLPSEVASQVYAVKPPRAVKPRVHAAAAQQQACMAAGSGADQLQGEASSAAVPAAAALQAQRSLLSAAAALAQPAAARQQAGCASSSQQQQQQQLQARHTSAPGSFHQNTHQQLVASGSTGGSGHQSQQQWWLQYTPSVKSSAGDGNRPAPVAVAAPGDVPALCASVSPVTKSSSSRASSRQRGPAAAGSLECSSVMTGSVVVGALPGPIPAAGGGSGSAQLPPAVHCDVTAAAGCSAQHHAHVPPAPDNLRSASEVLPSPQQLLQHSDRQQLTASLVRQLSQPNNSSSGRAGVDAAGDHPMPHGHMAGRGHGQAQLHVCGAWPQRSAAPAAAPTAEHSQSGDGSRAVGVCERPLQQRCSAAAVTAAAAAADKPEVSALAWRLHHSQLAMRTSQQSMDLSRVSMVSGSSMAGDRPNGSRPGSRASDVCSIVSKAKERSAARQRLLGGTAMPRDSSSGSSHMLLSPRGLQELRQPLPGACAATGAGAVSSTARHGSCIRTEGCSGAGRAVAHGVAGGGQAVRMLQDYRTLADLDAAIKARTSQLCTGSKAQPSTTGAAAGACGGAAGVAAAGDRLSGSAARGRAAGKVDAATAAAGGWRAASALPPEADTVNSSDCSPDRQQRQQQRKHAGPGDADACASADGSVAVGLLGIWEALDNSFDAGRPGAAAVAAINGTSAGGCSYSKRGNRTAGGKQVLDLDAGYRNPFLSPSPTESPTLDVLVMPQQGGMHRHGQVVPAALGLAVMVGRRGVPAQARPAEVHVQQLQPGREIPHSVP
ncbi:hypothetical protein COO60DRAFT_443492 [Scenedesmus sp. NREL 46B-D3]|nr:hypothetical protein COO60DRAFT_443492 [Scenedesmus sp. NREL 46B-D3]